VNDLPHVSAIHFADRAGGALNQLKWFGQAQVASSSLAAIVSSFGELIGVNNCAFLDGGAILLHDLVLHRAV
jgi:hypothetical protein